MSETDVELPGYAADQELAPIVEAMRRVAGGRIKSTSIQVDSLITTSDERGGLKLRLAILSAKLKVNARLVVNGRPRRGRVTISRRE
jgi:hypothetical protein